MHWILIPLIFMVCWLVGGQVNTAARRYGLPTLVTVIAVWKAMKKSRVKFWVGGLVLLYIPVLSLGYGTNSFIKKLAGGLEWLTRLVYALLCCLPLVLVCVFLPAPIWKAVIGSAVVLGAFQIRAGRLFTIGKYDVLIEDIVRSLSIGFTLAWILS